MNDDYPKSFVSSCKVKFHNINNRCNNRKSYVARGIKNEFTLDSFIEFAWHNGLENGFHCHRPDRDGNYSPQNLIFIPEGEHRLITGRERRKLNDDQVAEIRLMNGTKSLRKIAKEYQVSHTVIFYLLKNQSYKN